MSKLTDSELIEELKNRFDDKDKALFDLKVTTRKLEDVNRKLQESEALKSDFLSNIRNEINNPLTSIIGMSREIKSGPPTDSSTLYSLASTIFNEAFNLDFQLHNIFAAAEVEAGETTLSSSNVDLKKLMLDVIDSFRHIAEENRLSVNFDCKAEQADCHFFRTDPEYLQVIASNLLSNALKYTPEGGTVTISVNRHEGCLDLVVEDSGIGIDEANYQVIFERFRQLDTGATKKYGGHGLGLSITRALVELLNGSISVKSVLNKGTVFTVVLPEAEPGMASGVFSEEGNEFMFDEEEKF